MALPSRVYFWHVRAIDNARNQSAYSTAFSLTVDSIAPNTPVLLQPLAASATNYEPIGFSWSPSADALSGLSAYVLQLATSTDFALIAFSSVTVATNASLSPVQSSYTWRVIAYDQAGNVAVSTQSFSVVFDTTPPAAVALLTSPSNPTVSGNTLVPFSWTAALDDTAGIANYTIELSTAPDFSRIAISSVTAATAATITVVESSYSWRVRSTDRAGNTNTGSPVYSLVIDTDAPSIVINEGAPLWTNSGRPYDVDFFDYLSGVNVASYTARTAPGLGGAQLIAWTTVFLNLNAQAYTTDWPVNFSLLAPGTNYISVRAADMLGNTSSYTDAFKILKDTIAPANITNLAGFTGTNAGEINLSWTAPADDALTDPGNRQVSAYIIKYSAVNFTDINNFLTSGTTAYSSLSAHTVSYSETTTITTLSEGSTFYIGIIAVDKAGNYSAGVSTSVAASKRVPPGAVTTLTAVTGGLPGEIDISWLAPADNGYTGAPAAGYLIKFSTTQINSEATFISATTSTLSGTFTPASPGSPELRTIQGLITSATYYIALKAYDAAGNYSLLSTTASAAAAPSGPAEGMAAFGEGSNAAPQFASWTGSSWNASQDALSGAPNTRYLRLKSCNVLRDQKIMGALTYDGTTAPDGDLYVQVWNGQLGSWINPTTGISGSAYRMNANQGTLYSAYRGFDIAYEQLSGRALIVYSDGVSGQVSYRVWSSTQNAWSTGVKTLTMSGATGDAYWIKTKSRPGTDDILLGVLTSNSNVFTAVWHGTGEFLSVSTRTCSTTASIATKEAFDVDWEAQDGRGMIVWGQGAVTPWNRYDLWSSSNSAWLSGSAIPTGYTGPITGATVNWLSIAADPNSNRIALSSEDSANDWNVTVWSGSAWATSTELTANDSSITSRCGDIAWEKSSGYAMVCGVQASSGTFNWSRYNGTSWTTLSGASVDTYKWSDILGYIELYPDPNTNNIVLLGLDRAGTLRTRTWNGTAWTGGSVLSTLVSGWTVGTIAAYQPAELALDLQDSIAPTIANNQTGDTAWRNASGLYRVSFTDSGGSHLSQVRTSVYTGPASGQRGNQLKDYSNGGPDISGINSDTYNTNWPLTQNTWSLLQNGTNYISIMVYDNAANQTELLDAFYVLKDTIAPVITNNESQTPVWENTGRPYNISFADQANLSKLDTVQYTAYSAPAQGGTQIMPWTSIANVNNTVSLSALNLNYNLLSANTNYISIRAWDIAGTTTAVIDAFILLKDTQPPANTTTLAAVQGPYRGTIDVSWIAPGDDGTTVFNGNGLYDLRVASYPISSQPLFDSATVYALLKPVAQPGAIESLTVTGLSVGTTYYFALRTRDKVPNYSAISNTAGAFPRGESVYINEVFAAGNGSWVELYNNLASSVSLSGWTLQYNGGTIDAPATYNTVWTAVAGSSIPVGGIYVISGLNLSGSNSYHVRLLDNNAAPRIVDIVQWPVLPAGSSFARITDGNPALLEIDPTPTPGLLNYSTSTAVFINEIDYASNAQFVELYSTSASVITMSSYTIRNMNRNPFTFTRKIYPSAFTVIDNSSVDTYARTWATCMGGALSSSCDNITLENASGQVQDRVVWCNGTPSYYNYKAALVPYDTPANANLSAPRTIGRVQDGVSSGNNAADLTSFTSNSYGMRNYNPTPATANTFTYPATGGVLPRTFKMTFALGANSSAGANNTVVFTRTGGSPDQHSPHIYRMLDAGVNTGITSSQNVVQTGVSFNDQDGASLVDGAVYTIALLTSNAAGAAPAVTHTSVTYDATVHLAQLSDNTPVRGNVGCVTPVMKLTLTNRSAAGANAIKFSSMTVAFTQADGVTPLSGAQEAALFSSISVFADNITNGTQGTYQRDIDTDEWGKLTSLNTSSGRQTIVAENPGAAISSVAPNSSKTYFVTVTLTANANVNGSYRALLAPATDVAWLDAATDVPQVSSGTTVLTVVSSATVPAQAPAGSSYPSAISTPGIQLNSFMSVGLTGTAPASMDDASVMAAGSDGFVHALDADGNAKWQFNAGSPITATYETSYLGDEGNDTNGNPLRYLYVATQGGQLYKIQDNDSSMSNVWGGAQELGSPVTSEIAEYGMDVTHVFLGTADGKIHKINTDGSAVPGWSMASGISGSPLGVPAIDEFSSGVNALWFGTGNGQIYRINNVDGSITSSSATATAIRTSPYIFAGFGDTSRNSHNIYFGDDDGNFKCRTSSNLKTKPAQWNDVHVSSPVRGSPVYALDNQSMIFGCDDGRIYKVDINNGSIYWSFQTRGPVRTMPLCTGDAVYFGSDDGNFYGLDMNGNLLPKFPISTGAEIRTNAIYDNRTGHANHIYFGSNNGKIYCIEP